MLIALQGAVSQGVLWGIMVLGVFITFRLLDIPDMTCDGSFALGGCVCAVLIVNNNVDPLLAVLAGMCAGAIAGAVTGILTTVFEIPAILAGILTQISLWSINLRIMGKSNTPILAKGTIFSSVSHMTGLPQSTVAIILGIVLAVLAAIVLFGGVKRLGAVTEKLVPFMAVVYILACLAVIVYNADALPKVFHDIFVGAFTPNGVTGGAVGSVFLVISWGMKRGIFSNEAGLGTAPMAHATTSEPEPVKQALYGIFEVFMDTIVICSLTGLTLLCSGINLNYGTMGETALVSEALGTLFTQRGGALVIAVALALFAFSTILGWALYGSRCCEFIFGHKAIKPYQILYVIVIVVGATVDLELVWDIADTLNGLMALPNLIALALLSGVVVKCTKAYFTKGTSLEEAE